MSEERKGAGGRPSLDKPRWEGPEESRPRGYKPAKDNPDNDPDASGETLKNPERNTATDLLKQRGKS